MALEDDVRGAIAGGDPDSVTKVMNLLRLDVIQAIRADEWEGYWQLEQGITDALVPFRSIIRSRTIEDSSIAWQMYALHGVVQALRESRATPREIREAARSEAGKKFLLQLRQHRRLAASEVKKNLGIGRDSQVSQLGRQLMDAGLVHRERIGRHASYRLTARGSIVARELQGEETLARREEKPEADSAADLGRDYYARPLELFRQAAGPQETSTAPPLIIKWALEPKPASSRLPLDVFAMPATQGYPALEADFLIAETGWPDEEIEKPQADIEGRQKLVRQKGLDYASR